MTANKAYTLPTNKPNLIPIQGDGRVESIIIEKNEGFNHDGAKSALKILFNTAPSRATWENAVTKKNPLGKDEDIRVYLARIENAYYDMVEERQERLVRALEREGVKCSGSTSDFSQVELVDSSQLGQALTALRWGGILKQQILDKAAAIATQSRTR